MLKNMLIRLICVSIVFFCKMAVFIREKINKFFATIRDLMVENFTLLYYFGEERLINYKKDNIKIPYNIGVILDNEKYEKIIFKLLKFINWNLKLGVNFINLYDPFSVINQENFEHFKNLITIIYSKKFYFEEKNTPKVGYYNLSAVNKDIILINKEEFYNISLCQAFDKNDLISDNKDKKHILSEKKVGNASHSNQEIMKAEFNLFKEKFNNNKKEFLIIKIINFKEANIDFMDISKIMNFENDRNFGLINPEVFDSDEKNASEKKDNTLYSIDSKFLTKKETNYLPEIIINFAKTELCMYGFPFALMENSEILDGGDITSISVTKYLKLYEKYTKIDKRFGK